MSEPTADRLQCDQEASQMVHDANLALGDQAVKNPKLNDLVASLTSLMLQIKVDNTNENSCVSQINKEGSGST